MNGLVCYCKGILCEIGAKIVNTHHALQSSIITLTSTYHCLRLCPLELVRILYLLIFGCSFFVGQRLSGWVVSKRLENKSAWSSSNSPRLIECVRLTSSNSKIQNQRATKGFILIRHKRYQIYSCLRLSSSIASLVWKPAHFEFRSYGGAWHNAKIVLVENYALTASFLAILGV